MAIGDVPLRKVIAWLVQSCMFGLLVTQAGAADITLRFSWWGEADRHDATMKAIRLFESTYKGVRVKAESMPFQGHYERISAQMSAGAEPDVMQLNWAWLSSLSPKGDGLYDLNQVKDVFHLNEEYPTGAYKSGLVNGKLNALPVSYTARVYMWQKSTFDRAGVSLPQTWDDLFAAGRAFRQKLGTEYYPLDGNVYDVALIAHAYIYQKTGKPYIYSNQGKIALSIDEALDWVHFYKRLSSEHVVVPLSARLTAGGVEVLAERTRDWQEGRWAGLYAWDSTLAQRQVTLPKGVSLSIGDISMPGAKNSGMFGRPSMVLAVSKNSKHPQWATKLIHFLLTDPAAAQILGTQRGIPLSHSAFESVKQGKGFSLGETSARDQINAARIDLPSPYREHPRIQTLLREVFEDVAFDRVTERMAAERLVNEGNRILRELK